MSDLMVQSSERNIPLSEKNYGQNCLLINLLFLLYFQVSWHHTKKFNNFAGSQVNYATDQTCVQIQC